MKDYGSWKGTPRERIPWFPTVDLTKCVGCRRCFEFCSHGVYAWDDQLGTPQVIEPFQCVVGCSSCSHECAEEAIAFPQLAVLKEFVRGT